MILSLQLNCRIKPLNSLEIIPSYQGKGIGIESMRQFEEHFSGCNLFSLDTPKDKKYNICFYEKCGYKIVGEDNSSSITCVLFEKKNR
jgi:ribosomal protein S18 acetylase RimI-like enzyme